MPILKVMYFFQNNARVNWKCIVLLTHVCFKTADFDVSFMHNICIEWIHCKSGWLRPFFTMFCQKIFEIRSNMIFVCDSCIIRRISATHFDTYSDSTSCKQLYTTQKYMLPHMYFTTFLWIFWLDRLGSDCLRDFLKYF